MQEYIPRWIVASIYCPMDYWGHLLENGVKPYINSKNKTIATSYQLDCNFLRGANIQFYHLSDKGKEEQTARELDQYFKNFLSSINFCADTQDNIEESIFLPFPQNTIQYGLFKPKLLGLQEFWNPNKERYSIELNNVISATLLKGLCSEKFDKATLIAVAFYLNASLCKSLITLDVNANKISKWYTNEIYDIAHIALMEDEFICNRDQLFAIIADISNLILNSNEATDHWLYAWIGYIKLIAQKYITDDLILKSYCEAILNITCKKLAFSEKTAQLLKILIKRWLDYAASN